MKKRRGPVIIGNNLECACGAGLYPIETSYGFRANCLPCNIRWTWINGEDQWVAEKR